MTSALARFIRSRRRELGLSQEALASCLSVTRQVIAAWESGGRPVSAHHFPLLSHALSVAEQTLRELFDSLPQRGCVLVRHFQTRVDPVRCSLDDMTTLRGVAVRLHKLVSDKLGRGRYNEVRDCMLRDTGHELLLAHHLLAQATAELAWLAPLEGECPLFISEDDKRSYSGHYRQLSIRWETDEDKMLFFPQVPLLVPKSDVLYRVDYLVGHWRNSTPPCWLAVELDGKPHSYNRTKDEERTARLPMSVIRFDNDATERRDFLDLLLHRIRESADYGRAVSKAYGRFLAERKSIRQHR